MSARNSDQHRSVPRAVLCAVEMTCYVDTVRAYPNAGLRFTDYCHLLADTQEELHAMAAELGIPRRAFQDHPWRWHYDLPAHLRPEAVRLGAVEVTMHAIGALIRARRAALGND
jgi:hypothetical protein